MSKNKIFFLVFISFLLTSGSNIFAHVLETAGSIGMVLHVDPDDDPIAKVPSKMYFDFKDKAGDFDINNCTCYLKIYAQDELIHTERLIKTDTTFTFPNKNVYTIRLEGEPKTNPGFNKFSLSYDLRVDREVDKLVTKKNNSGFSYIFFSALLMISTVVFIFVKKKGGEKNVNK